MSVTDVHAHVLLPALQDEVRRRDPEGFAAAEALDAVRNGAASQAVSGPMVGARIPKLTDVRVRLAAMDEQGVDRQWVSASPNHFYPWAGSSWPSGWRARRTGWSPSMSRRHRNG
ncbi:hypothetical protein [Microbacterium elymi]|uniref:hypothetical protein n=1 Tax=Microbacterium elymi TaxID=2909587 RepID=UPI003F49AED5